MFRLPKADAHIGRIRMVPLWGALFLLPLLLAVPAVVRAQASDSGVQPPKDVAELFDLLVDIDKLRMLNPLKLTPAQIDKTIAAVNAAKESYDKRVAVLASQVAPSVRQLAGEIREVKKNSLAGAAIPKAFDDKVKALQAAYAKQLDGANFDNWSGLVKALRGVFSEEQVATAVKLVKVLNPRVTSTDDKWLNLYVLQMFIEYPRIVPLLKDMKAAAETPAKSGDAPRGGNNRRLG